MGPIPKIPSANVAPTVEPKEKFGKVLDGAKKAQAPSEVGPKMVAPGPQRIDAVPNPAKASSVQKAVAGKSHVGPSAKVQAVQVIDQVSEAQKRLDKVLAIAQSGKSFTPAELLAMQANVYRASQELDLAGKVVEKATSGVKQVLQTQI